jgi:transcriptional regulator with XRE-family HTH domain
MPTADRAFAMRVASQVRQRRLDRSWSLEVLAEKSGLHRTSLGLIERGERHLTLMSAKRLADALDVELWELVKAAEAG